jgi:hypothetical protein
MFFIYLFSVFGAYYHGSRRIARMNRNPGSLPGPLRAVKVRARRWNKAVAHA